MSTTSAFPFRGLLLLVGSPVLRPMTVVGIVSFALACSSIAPFSERLEVYGLPAWLSVLLAIITAFLVPEVIVSMGVWLFVAPLQQRLARKVLESLQVLVVDTHADGGGVTGGASSPDAIGTGVAGHELATTERRKTHWYKWFAIRASVFVLSFPINAIPLLGQVLYFYINGTLYAWQLQEEYLVLKGYNTRSEQYTYVYFRLYDYAIYGSTCLLFELLLPGLNAITVFGNIVGANMWAAQLHNEDLVAPMEQASQWSVMPDDDDL